MLGPGGKRTKVHSLPLRAASQGLREAELCTASCKERTGCIGECRQMKLAMPLEVPRKTFDEEGVPNRDGSLRYEQ